MTIVVWICVHPYKELTLMSHQFSNIRRSSYYLYRDVIYLDYPADEPVVFTVIFLSSLY